MLVTKSGLNVVVPPPGIVMALYLVVPDEYQAYRGARRVNNSVSTFLCSAVEPMLHILLALSLLHDSTERSDEVLSKACRIYNEIDRMDIIGASS